MGKPKVRYDAIALAEQCSRAGVDVAALPAGPDGWHTRASITAACRSQGLITMTADQPARSNVTPLPARGGVPAGPWGDGDPVQWAYLHDKFPAARAPHWRAQYRRDPEATARRLEQLVAVPGIGGGKGGYVHPVSARFAPDPSQFVDPRVWASASARASEPPPRLFNSGDGDVPAATASGLPPETLYEIPWRARHAVAAEPDRGRAYHLVEKYSGPDGETLAEMDHGKSHEVAEYREAVKQWAGRNASDDAVFSSMYGDDAAARGRQAEADNRAQRRSALQRGLDAIDREEGI